MAALQVVKKSSGKLGPFNLSQHSIWFDFVGRAPLCDLFVGHAPVTSLLKPFV